LIFNKAGEISDGTVIENLSLTDSNMTVRTSASYAVVGGMIGMVKTSTLTNLSMSNTSIVYAATDSSSTLHLYTGLLFGYLSTNFNGADITITTVTSNNNSLQHDQASSSKNYPGLLAGYAVAGSSWGNLSVTNFTSTGDALYMFSWPNSKTWTFGTMSQNFIITETGTSITSLTLSLPE